MSEQVSEDAIQLRRYLWCLGAMVTGTVALRSYVSAYAHWGMGRPAWPTLVFGSALLAMSILLFRLCWRDGNRLGGAASRVANRPLSAGAIRLRLYLYSACAAITALCAALFFATSVSFWRSGTPILFTLVFGSAFLVQSVLFFLMRGRYRRNLEARAVAGSSSRGAQPS